MLSVKFEMEYGRKCTWADREKSENAFQLWAVLGVEGQ